MHSSLDLSILDLMLRGRVGYNYTSSCSGKRSLLQVTDTAYVNSQTAHLECAKSQSAQDRMPAKLSSQQMKLWLLDLVTCFS